MADKLVEIESVKGDYLAFMPDWMGADFEWLIDEVKRLRKVADAVTAVRVAKPENYQDAVFELDEALMDAGCFWVKDPDRRIINDEVAARRFEHRRLVDDAERFGQIREAYYKVGEAPNRDIRNLAVAHLFEVLHQAFGVEVAAPPPWNERIQHAAEAQQDQDVAVEGE
jgi:hypothetical protein